MLRRRRQAPPGARCGDRQARVRARARADGDALRSVGAGGRGIGRGARTLRVIGTGTRCTIFLTAGRYRGSFYVSTLEIGNAGQLSFTELVDRHGRVVRKLDGNPFAVDWNGDGAIQGDETMPECLDPPPPQAALEAIMKKL